jgi:hypothetical protein
LPDKLAAMLRRILSILLLLVATQALAAAQEVTVMRTPNRGLQPQIVVDGATVHLLTYQGDPKAGDLYYRRSDDGGNKFGSAVRVNSQSQSAIALGTIRGGQIALGRDGRVHVAWNGSQTAEPRVHDGAPMLYSCSDGRGGFRPQRNLMADGFGLDGGGSVAADRQGRVFVMWHACPVLRGGEQKRRVYLALSTDDGATFASETPVWDETTGACGCCQLKPWAQDGKVRLLYRACVTPKNRDTFLLVSDDAGTTFHGSKIHPWTIPICPMASYAFSPDGTWAAWESNRQIYWAPVAAPYASAIRAAPGDAENRKHPVLTVNSRGEVLLAWTAGGAWGRGGKVQWQLFDAARNPLARGERDGLPAWSNVAAFARSDGSFVVMY